MTDRLAAIATDRAALRDRWYAEGRFTRRTIGDELADAVLRAPSRRVAFVGADGAVDITLADLNARAKALGAGLTRLGLRPGDVVAIQAPCTVDTAVAYQAAFLQGFILLPVVHMLGPAELSFILRQAGAKALVTPRRYRSIDFAAQVAQIDPAALPAHVIVMGEPWPGALGFDDLCRTPAGERAASVDADDCCLIIYTSGTTAEPKGAKHSHNSFLAQLRSVPSTIPRGDGKALGVFPTGHIAGTIAVMSPMVLGEDYVFLETFDPRRAAMLVSEHRVTGSAGTPYHLKMIIDEAEAAGSDLGSLTAYLTGAASVPVALLERADRMGIRAYRGFGMTEHPEATSSEPDAPRARRFLTDGHARYGSRLRILDDAGEDVPAGMDGEIALIGPRQSIGYVDPERDLECYIAGGWFLTGDVGRLTPDGDLVVTDRKKDIINRGGEKLSAREIEEILSRMDQVAEACVTSMPDDRLGEAVRAFLILKPGAAVDLPSVEAHFTQAGIARQKTPQRIDIVADYPRTPAGKPRKVIMRGTPL